MQQCKGYTLFTSYTCLPIPAFFSMQLSCILKVEIVIGKKIHQVGLERKRRFNTIIADCFLYFMDNPILGIDDMYYKPPLSF